METPKRIRFELLNGLGEEDVKRAKYVVYAHRCPGGTYVGMSEDPVGRWKRHVKDATRDTSESYNDNFKQAIRTYGHAGFTHYIIAIASFPKAALKREAAAIRFYGDKLNSRLEVVDGQADYDFRTIDSQIPRTIFLEARSRADNSDRRSASNRRVVRAKVVREKGRKRLISLPNDHFPEGLRIECDRRHRDEFDVGDCVELAVALSTKPNGGQYLVAAATAKITKVEN